MNKIISLLSPQPVHNIFQDKILKEILIELGYEVEYQYTSEKADLIICTSISQHKKAEKYAKQFKKPIFTWVMDINPFYNQEDFDSYRDHILKAKIVASLNEKVKWDILKWVGVKYCNVLFPCIDNKTIEETPSFEKEDTIVVVGRLDHVKRPDIAFLAWEKLEEPRPTLKFIYQHGWWEEQLKNDANKYGLQVQFLKGLNDKEKYEEMKKAKLLIMPCEYGGFNMPPIEAYYCDTPSLVSDDHCYSTYEKSVWYFKTNNVKSLVDMIPHAYGNYDMIQDNKCQALMSGFTIEALKMRMNWILKHILK